MGALMLLGMALGGLAGLGAGYLLYPSRPDLALLAGLGAGSALGWAMGFFYWSFGVPPAFKQAMRAARTGFLIVAVGADKKARLLPGFSDGFVVRPAPRPYRDKYAWAADGESSYPIHGGRGTQLLVTFMGYPFPLEAGKAAAVSKFRERGFRSIEDLKTAVELPTVEEIEARMRELEAARASIEKMDEGEVRRLYGEDKRQLLAEVDRELERLERVRELVKEYGGGSSLTVNVDGATVRASDLISYLVWRHHPSEIDRIVKAETNAVLSRLSAVDWLRQLLPVIIVTGMFVLGIIVVVYMLKGGGPPAPVESIAIGGG
ncbi:hypothetical protein APE_0830 [Aeropyrum pernix spindle-shaped virus 1]|uniref:Uncharacterized protein n=2 Tax=root TaxID=1 RepID=Q9YDT7_AERPE|nr:hypothetical protein APE_0830 [Aeropyrum pernix spindle-shaped virus 1] [Aeropyrum pernix K1]